LGASDHTRTRAAHLGDELIVPWVVLIEREATDGDRADPNIGQRLEELARRLVDQEAIVQGHARAWGVFLTLPGKRAADALIAATDLLNVTAPAAGLPMWPVARSEAWPADVMTSYLSSKLPRTNLPGGTGP
jgi:hypothetical protein